VAARHEELNRRLQALGIISLARNDKTPRLTPDDWDKLAALAEAGHASLADTP
jgi:predicted outer membrane protein